MIARGTTDTRLSDADAIERSLEQPSEFYVIVDRHLGVIHRYLQRRCGADLADELAAETFAQAFSARKKFDPAYADARPWLYGVAANVLRNHRRTEERRLRAYARAGAKTYVAHLEETESRLDGGEWTPALARALARLSPRNREVLLLFAWADLSYEEIARALGIPGGTVRSRLSRARAEVRAQLVRAGHLRQETATLADDAAEEDSDG